MQVDPIKPTLKPPGTKHLKLKRDVLLSSFAFIFDLRRYMMVEEPVFDVSEPIDKVGRCRLTLSNPR